MRIEETGDKERIEELCSSNEYISKPTENFDVRQFFLVKDGEGDVGCGYIRTFPGKIGNLGGIFVRDEYRKQGIGKFLVNKLEEKLDEKGIFFILIGVHRDNEGGMKFWNRMNYHTLIESLGEDVLENKKSKEFLEKIIPIPLPNKGVTLMAKRLVGRGKLKDIPFYDELKDLRNSFDDFQSDLF